SFALFLCLPSFGEVYARTHKFDRFARSVENRMTDRADVFSRAVRQNNAEVNFEIGSFPNRAFEDFIECSLVLGMNTPIRCFEGQRIAIGIEPKQPILFLRPVDVLSARHVPCPAASVA